MLHIVTDSSCDLPEELVKQHNIRVIPLTIRVGGCDYLERVDITPEAFYARMAESSELPKTSQPPPAAFADAFRQLSDYGPVICLTISCGLAEPMNRPA